MTHRALETLMALLRSWSISECQDVATRAGLKSGLGVSARTRHSYHHVIDANAFLGLCAVSGVDAYNGTLRTPRLLAFDMVWHVLGAGFIIKRTNAGLSLRSAASIVGVSAFTLSRLENGQHLSVESMLAVCTFMGVHPEHYALIRDVSRGATPNTLNPKEAA